MSRAGPGRFWLVLSLVVGVGTAIGAVVVRVMGLYPLRIGAWFGALVLVIALAGLVSGIAAFTGWRRAVAAAVSVTAVGAAAEIAGLYHALPFGRYEYTDWWVPYVHLPGGSLFPILLPPTWFLIVASCYLVLARRLAGWRLVAAAALLATLVDLTSEAVLTNVVLLWRWLEPTPLLGAPYRNAPGWIVTAGAGAAALQALGIHRARSLEYPAWMMAVGLACAALIGVTHGEPRGALMLALLPILWWAARGRAGEGEAGAPGAPAPGPSTGPRTRP